MDIKEIKIVLDVYKHDPKYKDEYSKGWNDAIDEITEVVIDIINKNN
jgi:hypothetical protein